MVFNIQKLINGIKSIDGVVDSNAKLLDGFFFTFITKRRISTNKKELIDFTDQRASEVMSKHIPLFQSLTRQVYCEGTRELLKECMDTTFRKVLINISITTINKVLLDMVNKDTTFDKKLKKEINEYPIDSKNILADCLFYCLQYDEVRNQYSRKLNNPNERFNDDLVDISIIAAIVNEIAKYKKKSYIAKSHHKAYSVEDKMLRNKITGAMYHRIVKAFDDYNYVMDAIDNLNEGDIFASKDIYSFYNDTYLQVLDDMNIDVSNVDDIIENSEVIFKNVNEKIYLDVLNTIDLGISIEKAKMNLFSVTTAVFYKCKFLISLEGDESDSN